MTRFHLHLVSDATGDTVHSVARACLVQFEGAEAIEHIWNPREWRKSAALAAWALQRRRELM